MRLVLEVHFVDLLLEVIDRGLLNEKTRLIFAPTQVIKVVQKLF